MPKFIIFSCLFSICYSTFSQSEYSQADVYYKKALDQSQNFLFERSNNSLEFFQDQSVQSSSVQIDLIKRVDALNLLGYNHYRLYNLTKSQEYYSKAFKLLKDIQNKPKQAYVRTLLGLADIQASKFQADSISFYTEKALDEIRVHNLSDEFLHQCHFNLGKFHVLKGNMELPEKYFLLAKLTTEQELRTEICLWRANLKMQTGQLVAASILADSALIWSQNKNKPDSLGMVNSYMSISYINHAEGRFRESIDILKNRALSILDLKDNGFLRGEVNKLIGWSYHRLGDYKNALEYNLKNLEYQILNNGKSHFKTAEAYLELSKVYNRMDLPKKTIDYLKQASQIYKGVNNRQLVECYFFLVQAYLKIGDTRMAESISNDILKLAKGSNQLSAAFYYQSLVRLHLGNYNAASQSIKNSMKSGKQVYLGPIFRAQQGSLQADILVNQGFLDSATLILEKACERVKSSGIKSHSVFTQIQNEYIDKLISTNKLKQIPELLDQAILLNTKNGSKDFPRFEDVLYLQELIMSFHLQAQYLMKVDSSNIEKANKIYSYCRGMILDSRGTFESQNDRIHQKKIYDRIFQESADVLIQLFKVKRNKQYLLEALEVIELNKSSVLREGVQSNRALEFLQIPDSIITQEAGLKKQLSYLQSELIKLGDQDTSAQGKSFKEVIFEKNKEYEQLILHLEKNYPEYHNLKYNTDVLSVDEIQAKLKNDEVLIEYFNSTEQTHVLTITRDTVYYTSLLLPNTINIEAFRESLNPDLINTNLSDTYSKYISLANDIYNRVLEEPLKHIKSDQYNSLRIIPDGLLTLIPFETLLISDASSNPVGDYKSLPYLFKNFDISYGYSATSMFKSFDKSSNSGSEQVLSFAPREVAHKGYSSNLSPLKWSDKEVLGIGDYFNNTPSIGDEASEAVFKNEVSIYPMLHLATHAIVNNKDPLYSKLLFSPPTDSLEDGMLHAFELYNMRLNSEMVVLSACDTGFGKLETGEGVMSLARAFAYAGCPSIVMSHWAVDDKSTSILMKYYYKHLSKGEAKDRALRNAKLDFLENSPPAYHHPYYWNNFVVAGDVKPISSSYISARKYLSLMLLAALIIIFVVVRLWKRYV